MKEFGSVFSKCSTMYLAYDDEKGLFFTDRDITTVYKRNNGLLFDYIAGEFPKNMLEKAERYEAESAAVAKKFLESLFVEGVMHDLIAV